MTTDPSLKSALNLLDPRTIKNLSAVYGITLGKRESGQHCLICPSVLKEIIEKAELSRDDCVLEIGPGFGTLTIALGERSGRVIAVESDPRLARAAGDMASATSVIEVRQGEILKMSEQKLYSLFGERYKLVSNIPYAITSRLVKKFLNPRTSVIGPKMIVWLVQKEVGYRMAGAGSAKGLLTLAVQRYAHIELSDPVPASCFWPEPEVESIIVKISPYDRAYDPGEERVFWSIAKAGFSSRRKQLHHNLRTIMAVSKEDIQGHFERLGLSPQCRAQDVSIEQWEQLARLFGPLLKTPWAP